VSARHPTAGVAAALLAAAAELRLQGGIGSESSVLAEWYQPLDDEYRWFVAPGGRFQFREVKLFVDGQSVAEFGHGPNTLALGFEVDAPLNDFDKLDLNQIQPLGGLLRLSGLRRDELFGPYLLLGRAIAYRRIADPRVFSLGLPVYLGASLETGNAYSDSSQITGASLLWGCSAFLGLDTPLGPLFFGYGHTEGGNNAVFLGLGRFF
jgi:NTE family protein